MDSFPVWLSLRVALSATALTLLTGVPTAWLLARKRFPGRNALEAVVVLPLVLPPTVLGYYLLVVIGYRGPIGRVLAAIALVIKSAQAGFETVDRQLEQAARTLGRSEWGVFWGVTLPLAWRSVLAGTVLAFCRALGEFGITLMVAGNIPGRTQTLPLAIYDRVQANQMGEANALALVAVGIVVVLLFGLSRLARLRY